jgi:Replication initiation factor
VNCSRTFESGPFLFGFVVSEYSALASDRGGVPFGGGTRSARSAVYLDYRSKTQTRVLDSVFTFSAHFAGISDPELCVYRVPKPSFTEITECDAQASELPPSTDRGVTVAWAGIHWLSGSTRIEPNTVLDTLSELLNGEFVKLDRGGMSYTHRAIGPGGVSVFWTPGRADSAVTIPGEACERLGTPGLVAARDLLALSITRFDLAWDIEGITPRQVRSAYQAGNVVARAHRDSWSWHESSTGSTFYVGSRQSPRMVRFYDRRGPTRMELELHSERAQLVWDNLMTYGDDEWSRIAMSHVRSFIDFRDRDHSTRPSDCPLLPWWSQIIVGAERSKLLIQRVERSLQDVREWLDRSIAPALALVARSMPDSAKYLDDLVRNGRLRWRTRHHVMLARAGELLLPVSRKHSEVAVR